MLAFGVGPSGDEVGLGHEGRTLIHGTDALIKRGRNMNLSFHHGRIQQERGHLQTSKKDLTHTVGTLALDLTRLKNYEKQVSC